MGSKNKTRCIAISSSKGGVGKSIIALNLALELGLLGNQVGLLDLNVGVGTADRLCGLIPEFHLGHVIAGWKTLDEIKIELTKSVSLYPNVGDESLIDLAAGYSHILTKLQHKKKSADFILVDTASGVSENVIEMLLATQEAIVVVTNEPNSIIDAYKIMTIIMDHSPDKEVSILVNNIHNESDGEGFDYLGNITDRFLGLDPKFLGIIPYDPLMNEAVRKRKPIVDYAPDAPASLGIRLIAKNLTVNY